MSDGFENLLQHTFGESSFVPVFGQGQSINGDSGKKYEVLDGIVATDQSQIFEVKSEDGLKYALKVCTDDRKRKAQFTDETETLKILNSARGGKGLPGIIRLEDTIIDKSAFVLEYFGNENLEDKTIKRGRGNFGLLETLSIALPLSEILSDMHSLNVVHRDFKPANVLLSDLLNKRLDESSTDSEFILQPGEIKLCDFGISIRGGVSETHPLTRVGYTLGTRRYSSPEVISGLDVGSYPADVWALGVTFYDMISPGGLLPGKDDFALSIAIQYGKIPKLEDHSDFGKLVDSMLSHFENDRPTMAQVRDKINEIYLKNNRGAGTTYTLSPIIPQAMGFV